MSPGPVPPGPLLPAAVFGFLWLALALFVAALVTGCNQQRLTPGACDAREVARFTAECRVEVEATCGPPPAFCAAEEACDAELCVACPKAAGCKP